MISDIPQHELPEHRDKGGRDEQGNLHDVGEHFFQVFDPRPTCGTVRIGGGHGQRAPVGKNLVNLLLIEINPRIAVITADGIVFERYRGYPQIGAIYLSFAPGRQIGARLCAVVSDFPQFRVERGEEMTTLVMIHESTEKRLIAAPGSAGCLIVAP
ncbi:hypothetical protein D3C71_1217850 [compost metagenome]